ncbi:MAG TPA: lytic transglycosylase domain-containing protein [Candidatus Hydrogenedentes bacterium]|nr:lytic transglycosylase domain-containing protein [Candidatus Hydrogenedentota bacterium]HIJ74323.1 lytic transglycosylase domain-containing protein [Candidatus Hydrogenedentota bacterium]
MRASEAYGHFTVTALVVVSVVVFAALWPWHVAAQETGSEENPPDNGPPLPAENVDNRGAYFLDKHGRIVVTNAPERYRSDGDYQEVSIKFEPITVPGRFQSLKSPYDYSPANLRYLVRRCGRKYGVNEALIVAVMRAESDFDPYAVSRAGARGLMQLMPATAEDMGVNGDRIFDPAENIAGGAQYLSRLLAYFKNDLDRALAGYNAGPEIVKKYRGVPPYKETREYVNRVRRYRDEYTRYGIGDIVLKKSEARSASALPRTGKKYYTVEFRSGLTQPAEKVTEDDGHYCLTFNRRAYRVSKERVKRILKPER